MSKKMILPMIIIFSIVFTIGYLITRKQTIQQKDYYDNYSLLERKHKYKGRIIKKHYTHGRTFVEFQNGTKHSIPWAYNYDYKAYFIADFLLSGDSILKPANSDTLFIYREHKEYYFILEKRINE